MRTPSITWAYAILWFFAFYLTLASVVAGMKLSAGTVSLGFAIPIFVFAIGHILALICLYRRGVMAKLVTAIVSLLHVLYFTVALFHPVIPEVPRTSISPIMLYLIWAAGSFVTGLPIFLVCRKSSARYLGLY